MSELLSFLLCFILSCLYRVIFIAFEVLFCYYTKSPTIIQVSPLYSFILSCCT